MPAYPCATQSSLCAYWGRGCSTRTYVDSGKYGGLVRLCGVMRWAAELLYAPRAQEQPAGAPRGWANIPQPAHFPAHRVKQVHSLLETATLVAPLAMSGDTCSSQVPLPAVFVLLGNSRDRLAPHLSQCASVVCLANFRLLKERHPIMCAQTAHRARIPR